MTIGYIEGAKVSEWRFICALGNGSAGSWRRVSDVRDVGVRWDE